MQSGQRFNKWTLIREVEKRGKNALWECICECGRIKISSVNNIVYGKSISCGCVQKLATSMSRKKHGMSRHPLYVCWQRIHFKCKDPEHSDYRWYGLRGIKVDYRWETFEQFLKDVESTWKKGLSLDRIDVNGEYGPNNFRWATQSQQMRNTTKTIYLQTPDGYMSLMDAADKYGIDGKILRQRYRKSFMLDRLFDPKDGRIGNKRTGHRSKKLSQT